MTTDSCTDMYEHAYHRVSAVLDRALGTEDEDGAGEGLAGDVALLAQRYLDLKRAVLTGASDGSGWRPVVAVIEDAELRDEWWEAA